MKRKTTAECIKDFHKVHNDEYDYSKVKYKNNHTKVCIICRTHGDFWQKPLKHLQGQGCPKCCNTYHYTTEEWIEEAKKIHTDKDYDYSNVVYKNNKTEVSIKCKKHGIFFQKPNVHLLGHGCPKCVGLYNYTTEEWVEEARKIHLNEDYDYSKVIYKNAKERIMIGCKLHGVFYQTPNDHLSGCGCPKCKASHIEGEIRQLLAENNIEFKEQKKFSWLGLQSLDFYLPKYKIGIECQGIQHFEPIEHFGGEDNLIKTQERDKVKLQRCTENNVEILYYANYKYEFPYEVITDKNELLNKITTYKQIV